MKNYDPETAELLALDEQIQAIEQAGANGEIPPEWVDAARDLAAQHAADLFSPQQEER